VFKLAGNHLDCHAPIVSAPEVGPLWVWCKVPSMHQNRLSESSPSRGTDMARTKRPELTALLRTVPIFSTCTAKELSAIAAAVKEMDFPAGKVICEEGQTGVGLHVIVQGETKVQIGGRTRSRLGPGAFFGEIALLDGGPRTATIVAETPVKALSIVIWDFKAILKSQSNLALKMLEEVCRRLRATNESSLTH
jgi:CRP/FNR family transcriptional regulator, cyclic AMP receptor protein